MPFILGWTFQKGRMSIMGYSGSLILCRTGGGGLLNIPYIE